MKKGHLFIGLVVLSSSFVNAQNYQISFAGTGASNTVDSVQIENLTQCTKQTLNGTDTLFLTSKLLGMKKGNLSIENSLLIYPNPMTEHSTIQFKNISSGYVSIELYDIAGRTVSQTQNYLQEGNQTFDIFGLSTGTYSVIVRSGNLLQTGTLVSLGEFGSNETDVVIMNNNVIAPAQINAFINRVENVNALIQMQYNLGDRLLFRAFSGSNYCTITTLIPTGNAVVTSNFVDCTDADGNHYAIVQIGNQTWMAENLRTSTFNNGMAINNVRVDTVWKSLTTPAFCWFFNDSSSYDRSIGKLYNWFTIDPTTNGNTSLCPVGWHVPTDSEWTTLQTYLGGWVFAGGKMKQKCSSTWHSPNSGATNETGFSAAPSGWRYEGYFMVVDRYSYYWSSTEWDNCARLDYDNGNLVRNCTRKVDGMTIRCIKD